ncbi:Transposon Ty3-G Gag-Pol polyprotein [Trichinella nativa]|uniref:RNA-directed DNA polymerase n=2 Tax=Trichinella TaxID=6333 RepID=A0A0V1KLV8_9BILA|nr:Transposon Ty3-G Gag-Pol polyprotein [Trichinella nativa]
MVSNVETWFEHMELYFRAGRIAPERRAALVQYHTDAEVRSIMRAMDVQETDDYDGLKSALFEAFGVRTGPERFSAEFFRRKQQRGECVRVFAGHLRRLFSKAFPEMSGSADKILLQQFKAGLSADSVKTAVLRSEMDNFAEAVEVAVKEERVVRELTTLEASVASVKTDAYQEDEPTAGRVTEAAAAAVTTRKEVGDDLAEVLRQLKELLTDNIPAATKRPLPRQRRRPERRGDRRCWKCGGLGHISRECQASSRDARASEVSITNRTLPVVVIRAPEIETPIVEGSVGGVRCDMLVDTGSAVTLANERFIRHLKTLRDVPKPSIRLETATGTELEITNACVTEIILGNSVTVQHTVLCVRELSHKILLGWDFMRYHGCTPDPTAGCLRMRQGNIPFRKSHAVALVRVESPQSELMSHHPAQEAMEKMLPSEQESSGKHRSALAAILKEFADVLSTSDEDLGRTSLVRHAIHTGDAKPVRCSPRRIPYHQRAQVESLLDEMLRQDVVEPSSSPWASPIVLVRKKDGSCRFCVDYRQLNNLTRKDAHPLPRIDDTLDALAGAQWFSTLDLASGYWQVEVEPQDREKTAFTTPLGLYQFKVMPFGLCNAPATFQRLMEIALRGLVGSDCLVYLDDVIVFGKTAEEHTARLREVFRRLREVGLKVKPEKCRLMKRRVAYLGHIISEKGIATDPSKTSAVREWPTPTCVSELRQFLGLASYYRKFVNGFANVAAPLHRLLEKGAEWDWSKACQSAFDTLKYHLTSAPVLAYPDFHRQFIVDVDASGDGLGAVLSQREEKAERVVAYASRTLTKAERRYCATRREMLGLVWALREFRPYLYGQRFLVRTDHSCLRWLTTFREPEGQVARWLESLAELDFEVEHRAGRLHGNADALSRTSCAQCGRLVEGSACAVQAAQLRTEDVAQSFKDQLLAAQQADPEIQLLRQWLVGASWPVECPPECSRDMHVLWQQRRTWVDEDGLIWRHRRGLTAEEGAKQALVPRALRNEVLQSMHDSRYAGHLGERRTLARVRSRFYWPGMSGDVHTWCRTCTQCARRKGPTKNNRAPMQAMAAGYPLQRVGMDILGPLEKTPSGNRYVLVLTDYFTKWTAAFPLANMEASTVAKVLVEKYVAYFGAPDCLHSDQGRSFEASVVLEMCRLFGIKKTRSSPYHPQGNGQAERFNRTLLDMLSIMVDGNPGQWDDMLPFVMLAYNSSVHESTGVTPAIAMLGRELRLPLDVQIGNPPGGEAQGLPDYIRETRERIDRVHELARDHLKTQQRRQKYLHDRHAKESRFCPNDRVWLAMPRRGKLDRGWEGPYRVVEVMGPQTYRVRHNERKRRTIVVHSDRMKRYHARDITEQPDVGDRSVRGGTTRRQEHQPPGAASPPSSEMKIGRSTRRRRPPGYLRDYIP